MPPKRRSAKRMAPNVGAPGSAAWRNRIVEQTTIAPGDLVAHPKNWRTHSPFQRAAVRGVLAEVGWVQDVIVNRRTGRMLDGHLRVELALAQNESSVPVSYVDVTEEEEALILATFDPLGAMASAAGDGLAALLAEVETGDAALQALLEEVAQEAEGLSLDAVGGVGGLGASPAARRLAGYHTARLVKAVLQVEDVAVFEEAIAATGLMNRGDAIVTICKAYLEGAR